MRNELKQEAKVILHNLDKSLDNLEKSKENKHSLEINQKAKEGLIELKTKVGEMEDSDLKGWFLKSLSIAENRVNKLITENKPGISKADYIIQKGLNRIAIGLIDIL